MAYHIVCTTQESLGLQNQTWLYLSIMKDDSPQVCTTMNSGKCGLLHTGFDMFEGKGAKDMTRKMMPWLETALQQCPMPHGFGSAGVLGPETNPDCAAAALLAWRSTCRLLVVSCFKNGTCQHFPTVEDIKSNVTASLCSMPKEMFQKCFEQWPYCWSKCVCVCARTRAQKTLLWGWLDWKLEHFI